MMNIYVQIAGLLAFLLITFLAAAIGGLFTAQSVGEWYASLPKPPWTPPRAVFGPVWTLLYILMAVAAWLVWREVGFYAARLPLALFFIQLVLNVGWSALFFGQRMPGAAFAELVILWLFILATLITFWRVTPVAGGLLIPYLLWVTYASTLNFAIWRALAKG